MPNADTPIPEEESDCKRMERYYALALKISSRVEIVGDCHFYTGCRDAYGYGAISYSRKGSFKTHRVALIAATGVEHRYLCALHSCDNPPCVNPSHLRWGTQKENLEDARLRGRTKRYWRKPAPQYKLSTDQMRNMIADFLSGMRPKAAALKYGITDTWASQKRKSLGLPPLTRGADPTTDEQREECINSALNEGLLTYPQAYALRTGGDL